MPERAISDTVHTDQMTEKKTSLLVARGVKLQKPSELEPTRIRLTIGIR